MSMAIMAVAALAATSNAPSSSVVQCTADGGHYRLIKVSGSDTALSAQIRVLRRDPGIKDVGEWSPAAGLLFILPKKNHTAGVQVYVDSAEPDKMRLLLRKPDAATATFAVAPASKTVPISARAEKGMLTVSAGPIEESTKINDKQIMGAALMCSSGEFEFTLGPGLQVDAVASNPSFDPWEHSTK